MPDRLTVLPRIVDLIASLNAASVPVTEATSFAGDLAFDSLTVMDLVASIEDEWDMTLPLNLLPELETVGQLADAVARITSAR